VAFLDSETGFERGATTLLLDREPRHLNRYNRTGPARVSNRAITGSPITVEYHQEAGPAELELALEQLTDAKAATLRQLADDPGPLTAKTTAGTSATYTVTIASILFEPIIGHYTDGAPDGMRYHRVELRLAVLEVNP
jgi:hypothetical protein